MQTSKRKEVDRHIFTSLYGAVPFHILTVLSNDPEAISLPDGENSTSYTAPVCPLNVYENSPVNIFEVV